MVLHHTTVGEVAAEGLSATQKQLVCNGELLCMETYTLAGAEAGWHLNVAGSMLASGSSQGAKATGDAHTSSWSKGLCVQAL
jgi:hypothetical protein